MRQLLQDLSSDLPVSFFFRLELQYESVGKLTFCNLARFTNYLPPDKVEHNPLNFCNAVDFSQYCLS